MQYIISDIHGCYEKWLRLTEKLKLKESDRLYILGDAVDRGAEPIKTLLDISGRKNALYLMGNHDYYALHTLLALIKNCKNTAFSIEEEEFYPDWMYNGGEVTLRQFLELEPDKMVQLILFLKNAPAYFEAKHNGVKYVLTHAGIAGFEEKAPLASYPVEDFIFDRADYSAPLFKDNTVLVTGHTPTRLIHTDGRDMIFKGNGHIAIDCGCVFGGKLSAYCIETAEEFYV